MRVVIVGATGNVGTALLRRLSSAALPSKLVGVARRVPDPGIPPYSAAEWVACDIGAEEAPSVLADVVRGADAVVHLAWQIQPSHDPERLWRTNVQGSRTVFSATAEAGVPHLVYASSVGAYGPGPKDRAVGEDWPTTGVPGSLYSQHKAQTERMLDDLQREHPHLTVTRLRPGLIFQREAASEITRYFLGRLVPTSMLRRVRVPVLPMSSRLRFQVVHTDDAAAAYQLVVQQRAGGAFNIAADPVLGPADVAAALGGARTFDVPVRGLRAVAALTWRARLQPTDPGWIDLAASAPILDTSRAREALGWTPNRPADDVLAELLDGMAHGAGASGPLLYPKRRRSA
jgi:nucleoside-diphosphate-sugar epimerase